MLLVLNPSLDLENYKNINNPKARKTVLEKIEQLDLVDIWREQNKDSRKFTWWKRNPKQQARLDFF